MRRNATGRRDGPCSKTLHDFRQALVQLGVEGGMLAWEANGYPAVK